MPGAVNRAFVHLLAVAWLLVAREANARDSDAEGRLRLEVTSLREAEPCGRAEELRARIAERLGRDPFDDDASARLRVTFDPSPRAWGAEVVLFDAHGERLGGRVLREEGGACEPLVASVVLTVAVLLEDLVPPSPTTPSTPVVVDTPSATLEETAPSPSPVEQPPPPSTHPWRPRVDAFVGGAGMIGGAPGPAAGGELLVGLDLGRARLELSGRAFFPVSSDGDVAVRTRLVSGRLAPCYGWPVASICAVATLGTVSAEATGAGVTDARSEGRLFAATGLGAISRMFVVEDLLFVRASIDALFAVARPGFDVGPRRVWTVPPLSASATLGLGIRFP